MTPNHSYTCSTTWSSSPTLHLPKDSTPGLGPDPSLWLCCSHRRVKPRRPCTQGGAGVSRVGTLGTGLLHLPATSGTPSGVPGLQKPSKTIRLQGCALYLQCPGPPPLPCLLPPLPDLPPLPGLGAMLSVLPAQTCHLVSAGCFLLSPHSHPVLPCSPSWPLPVPSMPIPFYTPPVLFLRPPCHRVWSTQPAPSGSLSSLALRGPFGLCLWDSGSGPPLPPPSSFRFSSQWPLVLQVQWALGPGTQGALDDSPAAGPRHL